MPATIDIEALDDAGIDRLESELRLAFDAIAAQEDPKALIRHMVAFDERAGSEFPLALEGDWAWQADTLDVFHAEKRTIVLKARQLGVTWLAAAYAVWMMLYRPGSLVLVYRQKQEEAEELVNRCWTLYQSLPEALRRGAAVEKPARNVRPSNEVELLVEGRTSRLVGMSSSGDSGHGKSAALIVMDEHARIERAGQIMKATSAAAEDEGKMILVSTANGRYNEQTQEGNHFHYLWEHADETGFKKLFLSWHVHPKRDDEWYKTSPAVQTLRPHERAEQYPSTPLEAFTFSQSLYFDKDALLWYANEATVEPSMRGRFVHRKGNGKASWGDEAAGPVLVYKRPIPDRSYALAADVASGRGTDYSSAFVIDLETMEPVAEIHGKMDADLYAEQIHMLGRWYNTAIVAVEDAGGWGEPVIIFLRDGKDGRPSYPKQYRHRQFSRGDIPEHKPFGFPMSTKTRPLVLEGLERAVRERAIPYLTPGLVAEMGSFVNRETNPSPRAQDGANDDRVMAFAVCCELYRQFGHHEHQWKPKVAKRRPTVSYPWQAVAA